MNATVDAQCQRTPVIQTMKTCSLFRSSLGDLTNVCCYVVLETSAILLHLELEVRYIA